MTDLFFSLSKIFWILAQPDHFLFILLLLGLFLWRSWVGVVMVWGVMLTLITISIYPLGNFMLRPLEQRFAQPELDTLAEPIAGIIVLGGGEDAELSAIHNRPEFNHGAERLMVVPALMKRYPKVKVIFTGGSGDILTPEYRGGDVARQWLTEQGLGARMLIESDSRNTHQNALYTRDIIEELKPKPEGKWLLVTSAFHMPRSVGVYRNAGIDVLAYPVDYRAGKDRFHPDLNSNMKGINTAVREWIGLLAYHYTDKTAEILPGPDQKQVVEE